MNLNRVSFPIKSEAGVPVSKPAVSRGRPRSSSVHGYVGKIAAMKVGHSFFVEGAKRSDIEFLRRPCASDGLKVTIRQVANDEIYGVAGVRVWREAGEFDEL